LGPALDSGNGYMQLPMPFSVTSDALAFDENGRGPGVDLRLQFEVVTQLPDRDRQVIKAMIEGIIIKHETKRLVGLISG